MYSHTCSALQSEAGGDSEARAELFQHARDERRRGERFHLVELEIYVECSGHFVRSPLIVVRGPFIVFRPILVTRYPILSSYELHGEIEREEREGRSERAALDPGREEDACQHARHESGEDEQEEMWIEAALADVQGEAEQRHDPSEEIARRGELRHAPCRDRQQQRHEQAPGAG